MTTPYNPFLDRMGSNSISPNPVMARASQAQNQYDTDVDQYNSKIESINNRMAENQKALELYMADNKPGKPLDFLPDWAQKPLENTFSGLYWVYSKFVSQPISFALLYMRQGLAYSLNDDIWHVGDMDDKGGVQSPREVWNDARYFSPGQAFRIMTMPADELDANKINVTDPLKGRWENEAYFNKGFSKYFTGGIDMAIAWWADPFVLGAKGGGAVRQATYVKPTTKMLAKYSDAGGTDFAALMESSTMQSMLSRVEKIKASSNNDPRALLNGFRTLKESPRGMDLASALTAARTRGELSDVLRISMGDLSTVGRLSMQNAEAASMMYSLNRSISAAGVNMATTNNPVARIMYTQAIANQTRLLQAYEKETQFLSRAIGAEDEAFGAYGSLNALYYNRFTSPMGVSFRNAVANAPRFRGDTNAGGPSNWFGKVVYSGLYSTPLRLYRLPGDVRPARYIDLHNQESWRGLEATFRDVRGISREDQARMLAKYINATPNTRSQALLEIEAEAVSKLADRYGVDQLAAREMYADYAAKRAAEMRNIQAKRYSNARMADPNNPGVMIYADEMTDAGEIGTVSPLFASQLENTHVLMDFNVMDKALRRNGSNFGKAMAHAERIPGAVAARADVLNRYWKFGQLLSFRYGIRAISDDLMSQTARYGTVAMMSRTGEGMKNMANTIARSTWRRDVAQADEVQMHLAQRELKDAEGDIAKSLDRYDQNPTRANRQAIDEAKTYAEDTRLAIAELETRMARRAADKPIITSYAGSKYIIEPAYGGTEGSIFQSAIANSRSWDTLAGVSAGRQYRNMVGGDFRTIRIADNESDHLDAWYRILNRQFANDPLARQILSGASESQMLEWMARNPAGRAHFDSLKVKNMSRDDLLERAMADIEDVLPPTLVGREAIADAILNGTLKPAMLKEIAPGMRPRELRAEMFDNPVGTNALTQSIDNAIDGFYRFANQLPAEKLSRSPLFAAQYAYHVEDALKQLRLQGVNSLTDRSRVTIARLARERSLNDVKRFSFNMDHESRLAHAMRFFSPFLGAQMESWARWARVIMDKPSTIPHAAMLFSSPTRAGWTTDVQGNRIDPDGYVTDPVTGERRLVPKDQRVINVQMHDRVVKQMEKMIGVNIARYDIPLDSMNVVLQNDPVWNPGFGPFVQIPIQTFADLTPTMQEGFREMGLLPYNNRSTLGGAAWMKEAYNAVTGKGMDQDVISVLRKQQYDYDNGTRTKKPDVKEAMSNARKMSGLKMIQKFFLPMTVQNQRGIDVDQAKGTVNYEPIKLFVDEYNTLMRTNPENAQEAFLDKYGESFFAFTTAMSKTNSTVPATTGGAEVEMKYKNLLESVDPELGGLIAGPEGKGPYSAGAYYYQLDHETATGSGVMKREKLSPAEWLEENQRKQGWAQYRKAMLGVQAELLSAGYQTFDDDGAEEFQNKRQAIIKVLTSPTTMDGQPNEHYNRAWEKDYNTQDRGFYERRIGDLRSVVDYFKVADMVTAQNPGGDNKILVRSDIWGLDQYIQNRDAVNKVLATRESQDINAKSNGDIKNMFIQSTMDLMERYIPFAELHSRYLARDMGITELSGGR